MFDFLLQMQFKFINDKYLSCGCDFKSRHPINTPEVCICINMVSGKVADEGQMIPHISETKCGNRSILQNNPTSRLTTITNQVIPPEVKKQQHALLALNTWFYMSTSMISTKMSNSPKRCDKRNDTHFLHHHFLNYDFFCPNSLIEYGWSDWPLDTSSTSFLFSSSSKSTPDFSNSVVAQACADAGKMVQIDSAKPTNKHAKSKISKSQRPIPPNPYQTK